MKNITGNMLNYSAALLLLCFGLVYFFLPHFMPYHQDALGKPWEDLSPGMQVLILALMRAVAGGFIAMAVATAYLQYRFHRDPVLWMAILILVSGSVFMVCSLNAIMLVWINTPGRPPLFIDLLGEGMLILGFVKNRRYYLVRRSARNDVRSAT